MAASEVEPARSTSDLVEYQDPPAEWMFGPRRVVPSNATLSDVVVQQAAATPEEVAVTDASGRFLTYADLNMRADRCARTLCGFGARPNSLVAVSMHRSVDLLAALLAVLKTGAAYVPLDPTHPVARHQDILEDSGVNLLLTEKTLKRRYADTQLMPVTLDDLEQGTEQTTDLPIGDPADRAYVLHTSGSTGRPKGVEVSHQSVVNLLFAMRELFGVRSSLVVLAATTISFDISVLELFLPLLAGGRVVIVDRDIAMDGARLRETLAHHQVNFMQATPVAWDLLIRAGWQGSSDFLALTGGDRCSRDLANALCERSGNAWNGYGPTEATIYSTAFKLAEGEGHVPIGRPIANTNAYVLDSSLQHAPIGVAGELFIGGCGVAIGYLHSDDLTRERFIADPFVEDPQARMYRTGDLAQWGRDGNIEFLGRLDRQIKIRGYRVEVEEIEHHLRMQPEISDAVVTMHENESGRPTLTGYVICGPAPDLRDVTRRLRRRLPDYMVPEQLVAMDSFPLSPSGKIDVASLSPPESERIEDGPNLATDLEEQMTVLWRDVFKDETLQSDDDFLDLGGHSLLALELVEEMRTRLGIDVPVTMIFEFPTIVAIVHELQQSGLIDQLRKVET